MAPPGTLSYEWACKNIARRNFFVEFFSTRSHHALLQKFLCIQAFLINIHIIPLCSTIIGKLSHLSKILTDKWWIKFWGTFFEILLVVLWFYWFLTILFPMTCSPNSCILNVNIEFFISHNKTKFFAYFKGVTFNSKC